MERSLAHLIKKDLNKKIILISGPRQAGKTTLSKLISGDVQYLNYDLEDHREIIEKKEWDRSKQTIILDEIHKMPRWKSFLKGIFDVYGLRPQIIVTGSARLDTYRKVGDSLAGRYFLFRLLPFDLKELKENETHFELSKSFKTLLEIGGFPEPYLDGNLDYYRRWRKTHIDIILRQDLISLEKINNIIGIEKLIRLLRSRVGSTISYKNLADDIGVDPKTVKNWLDVLESLFVIFKVTPYSKKIKNSLLKAPKYYFYDNGQVEGDLGVKMENLIAFSLYKELLFLEDKKGYETSLHYVRDKFGNEVDFVVVIDKKPIYLIESKWADHSFAKAFFHFEDYFKNAKKIQLVGVLEQEKTHENGIEMRVADRWLSDFSLQ